MINGNLYGMIFKRKSFHIFRNVGGASLSEQELSEIHQAYREFTPLYPDIETKIRIVPAEETTCSRGEEYCILLYSQLKEGYLQNIGYLGEQLDLYLVSKNIGTLWFGIGKPEAGPPEGMEFVIMIAIHKIEDETMFRKSMFKSKRKPESEIWEGDPVEGVTNIVRFAPSACNTQPWLVRNEDGALSIYRYRKPGKRGIMPADRVVYYNQIDLGIFLCFLDLCLDHEGIRYRKELCAESGDESEMSLNALYRLDESASQKQDE